MCDPALLLASRDVFSLATILGIMLCFTPVAVYIVWKLGWFSRSKWEEHRNQIDIKYYAPRMAEQRQSVVEDPQAQAQRGRYDLEVEDCLRGDLYEKAQELCTQRLADASLSEEGREMYARYIRVIREQFNDRH